MTKISRTPSGLNPKNPAKPKGPGAKRRKRAKTREKNAKRNATAKEARVQSAVSSLSDIRLSALDELAKAKGDAILDAILQLATDSTRRYELRSRESHYRALEDVYYAYSRLVAINNSAQHNVLRRLVEHNREDTPRTNKLDPIRTLLRAMLDYKMDPASARTAVYRDSGVIGFAAHHQIPPVEFFKKLRAKGAGLEIWSRSYRALHPKEKNSPVLENNSSVDDFEDPKTPFPPPASLSLDLSALNALNRHGYYALIVRYRSKKNIVELASKLRWIRYATETDAEEAPNFDQLINDIIRPIAE